MRVLQGPRVSTPSTRGSTRLESCVYRWVITHGAVPSPPCESKRSSLRVSTPSTPPRESTECDPGESTPDRPPVRPSGPSRQGTPMRTRPMRPHSRLRCAFVQRARRRPLTPPARPPTPLRVRRQRMRVLRVPCRAPCRAGYRSGYRATWGPAPASGCIATRRGETVPRALGVLGREGTLRTLAVLRDLMQVLTVPRVLRVPNVRTTDRGVGRQL